MTQSRTKYQFFNEKSLSQKLAFKIRYDGNPIYPYLAGTDPETSLKIGQLIVLQKHKMIKIDPKKLGLVMDLLKMRRWALFATSKSINEITKMGLQDPQDEEAFE